ATNQAFHKKFFRHSVSVQILTNHSLHFAGWDRIHHHRKLADSLRFSRPTVYKSRIGLSRSAAAGVFGGC
ncbi:MAG: hypothetical protein ACR2RF_33085, partial [Geminicoccaceae bacterium]